MPFHIDPATDGTLLNLKRIAAAGGERGPLHDEGVLDVIRGIERDGHFERDRTVSRICLLQVQKESGVRMLTDEEHEDAIRFLQGRGWTFEQGQEYAGGIDCAERLLNHFRRGQE